LWLHARGGAARFAREPWGEGQLGVKTKAAAAHASSVASSTVHGPSVQCHDIVSLAGREGASRSPPRVARASRRLARCLASNKAKALASGAKAGSS